MQNPFQTIDERLDRLESLSEAIYKAIDSLKSSTNKVTTLNRDQAAKYIGVSKGTVINLEKIGRLKPIRIGSAIRYSKEHLNEFIESQTK